MLQEETRADGKSTFEEAGETKEIDCPAKIQSDITRVELTWNNVESCEFIGFY